MFENNIRQTSGFGNTEKQENIDFANNKDKDFN